jgi:hypothetical protein
LERKRANPILIPGNDDNDDDDDDDRPVKKQKPTTTGSGKRPASNENHPKSSKAPTDPKASISNDAKTSSSSSSSKNDPKPFGAQHPAPSKKESLSFPWLAPTRPANVSLAEYRAATSRGPGAKTANLFIPKQKKPIKVREKGDRRGGASSNIRFIYMYMQFRRTSTPMMDSMLEND